MIDNKDEDLKTLKKQLAVGGLIFVMALICLHILNMSWCVIEKILTNPLIVVSIGSLIVAVLIHYGIPSGDK